MLKGEKAPVIDIFDPADVADAVSVEAQQAGTASGWQLHAGSLCGDETPVRRYYRCDACRAGWFGGRSVSIDSWVELLRAEGVEIHRAAADFLAEFGGLESANGGPGITRERESFAFDPEACVGEGDRFLEWSRDLGREIVPVGILDHGRFFLGLDESSELYSVEAWAATFGRMPAGMIHLVRGVMPVVLD